MATMKTDAHFTPSKASKPFDDENADTILRSCDGIDFYVFKGVLIIHSSIFRDMFSLPDVPCVNQQECGKPVVDLQEPSSTLDTLLRFCYPAHAYPKIWSKEIFVDVMDTAKKFEMEFLYEQIATSFTNDGALRVSPLECYALAVGFKLSGLARESARKCAQISSDGMIDLATSIDLRCLSKTSAIFYKPPAEQYVFLTCSGRYCDDDPSGYYDDGSSIEVMTRKQSYSVRGKKWWFSHIERIEKELGVGDIVKGLNIAHASVGVTSIKCETCRNAATRDFHSFNVALAKQVTIEMNKVRTSFVVFLIVLMDCWGVNMGRPDQAQAGFLGEDEYAGQHGS
ncbi:hypothetical protein CCMSSC00406_0008290 [Pleurotus cornucopiae]|uniref:Uncharacterized protein n=1 Tax=Pleurotus cornucopiae TaxID=5321 RepID=A0ACB7JA59_PLECO|nr:hypothetical protein CCMSSC00406_0008290 [Pleurotus cornucopiae]